MSRFVVYYRVNTLDWLDILPKKMKIQDFFRDYKPVHVLNVDNMEKVFSQMQGENWSPNGEMRNFILSQGLSHTSMSVGDVIYSQQDDKFYSVDRFGFEELVLT